MSRLETTPNRFVSKGKGVDVIPPFKALLILRIGLLNKLIIVL